MNEKNNNQEQATVIPVSVAINQFKGGIYTAINECRLHPTMINMCLKEICIEIASTVANYEQEELKQYQEFLKVKSKENESSEEDTVK